MIDWILGLFGYEYITASDRRCGIVTLNWHVVDAVRLVVKKEWVLPQRKVVERMGGPGLVQVFTWDARRGRCVLRWRYGMVQFRLTDDR